MISLPLTRGMFAILDDEDAPFTRLDWQAHEVNGSFYASRRMGSRRIYLHREILGVRDGREVDHADRNTLNDRRCNLRIATHAQNQQNQLIDRSNRSGIKGVCWDRRRGRWRVTINVCYKQIHLGYFRRIEDAAKAYAEAALRLHGEFAAGFEGEAGPFPRHAKQKE
jgi:hypothetical protein